MLSANAATTERISSDNYDNYNDDSNNYCELRGGCVVLFLFLPFPIKEEEAVTRHMTEVEAMVNSQWIVLFTCGFQIIQLIGVLVYLTGFFIFFELSCSCTFPIYTLL